MPQVASEEQRIRAATANCCEKPEVCHADILCFINDGVIEDHLVAPGNLRGQSREYLRHRDQVECLQLDLHAFKDAPQHLALRLREAGLSAKACYIAIRLPLLQLPGIDHLLPFGQQEMQAEFMATNDLAGLID
ncbi:hypothetical protein D9M70_525460 [compost metagenome]